MELSSSGDGRPPEIPPGIRPGEPPAFHKLGEYVFQELCRDLLDTDEDVSCCEVYGVRGQRQHGIDLLAPRRRNDGYDVAQCKAYASFTPAQVRAASDDFLEHHDFWARRNVRRFHLLVACDLSSKQCQDEIIAQRSRFAALHIGYDVWSASRIRNRLRLHPDIVRTYLPEGWVRELCGEGVSINPPVPPSAPASRSYADAAAAALLDRLADEASSGIRHRVEELRDAWRAGRRSDARDGVASIRSDSALWGVLSAIAQSHVLKFEASLAADEGDVQRARVLVDEARRIAPEEDYRRIEAVLEYRAGRIEDALERLRAGTTIEDQNLAAGILLDVGRLDEAYEHVAAAFATAASNAETHRIHALILLLQKKVDQACLAAQRASEIAPHWLATRKTAALVNYASSLSPAALPAEIRLLPSPVPASLVRRDDQSVRRLRTAAAEFDRLATMSDIDDSERIAHETHRLACLANDAERQEAAIAYCAELLEQNPCHPGAVAWAIGRQFPMDLAPVESALRTRLQTSDDPEPVITLVAVLLASERAAEAQDLLFDWRSGFEAAGSLLVWTFWDFQVRIALAEGDSDAMANVSVPAGLEGALLLRLRAEAEAKDAWDAFIAGLQEEWARKPDPLILFDLCRAQARRGQWDFAADHVQELVSGVRTPEALHFAVTAAVNARRLSLALTLLDENHALFPRAQLPRELRTLRVRVLEQLGDLPTAVSEAESLARDQPDLALQVQLARLLFATGDMARLSRVVEEVADRDDLDNITALRLAHTVASYNQALGTRLWRRAVSGALADEHLGPAVGLGFKLGLDAEVRPLIAALHAAAQRGTASVQLVAVARLPEMMREWNEAAAHVEGLYRRGEVPVHLVADRMNVPLSHLYHQLLTQNERSGEPLNQSAVSIRHGMRGLPANIPKPAGRPRINADVTALLLAEHLSILDEVERAYSPVRIPSETIPALVQMRDAYTSSQPTRDAAYREIIELRDQGQLAAAPEARAVTETLTAAIGADAAALASAAIDQNAYIVDYLPLRGSLGEPSLDPPDAVRAYFLNARAVADALHSGGPLSNEQYEKVLENLGTEGEGPALYTEPPLRSPLILAGNIPEMLSSAGLLRMVCRHFRVYTDRRELERAEAALARAEQQRQQLEWIDQLMDRLRGGVETQRYQILPISRPADDQPDEEDDTLTPLLSSLAELLRFSPDESDIIWADDRFATSYWTRDQVPIFSTLDLLQDMVERAVISPMRQFELILRLREGNVRFLPLAPAELLHHLRAARVRNATVLETEALSILRRSTAAVLNDAAAWLQPPLLPNGTDNPRSETQFLITLDRTLTESLSAVWDDVHATQDERRARADWLLDNLVLDFAAVRRISGIATPGDHRLGLLAAHLAALIAVGTRIGVGLVDGARDRRQSYFTWLSARVLDPRFEADPELVAMVAAHLKNTLFSLLRTPDDRSAEAVAMVLLFQQIFEDLPRAVHDEIAADPIVMANLRLHTTSTIEIGPYVFEHSHFVRAASAAIDGRSETTTCFGSDLVVNVEPVPGGPEGTLRLVSIEHGDHVLAAPILALLSKSISIREHALRGHPEWFDGSPADFDDWVAQIATADEPSERLAMAERWRKDSASLYYDDLQRRIRLGERLAYRDFLPPSGQSLLRHFRLDPYPGSEGEFFSQLNQAADELAQSTSVGTAIRRWWGLPIAIPEGTLALLQSSTESERRAELRDLVRLPTSPVSELHLLRLLWRFRSDDPAYARLVRRRALRYLTRTAEAGLTAFKTLMQWLEVELGQRAEYLAWPPRLRLAVLWLHADRVYSAFIAAGADPVKVGRAFAEADQRLISGFVAEHAHYALDIANPKAISTPLVVLTGFAYVFGDTRRSEIPYVLTERVSEVAFVRADDQKLPASELLRHIRPAGDLLNSFLGQRGFGRFIGLLGRKDAKRFNLEEWEALAEALVHTLEEDHGHVRAWVVLSQLLGHRTPTPELADRIAPLILATEFGDLLDVDPELGAAALQSAAALATGTRHKESQHYVRQQSIDLARRLGGGFAVHATELLGESSPIPAARWLLEVAVQLAKGSASADASILQLADHLADLVAAWPELGRALLPFVLRAMSELRVDEANHFTRLTVLCRAS